MCTDTRIQTYARYDSLTVQSLHLCISIQFIEIRYTQSQIGIGKQFHSLCLGHAHKQGIDILLDSTFLQQSGERLSLLLCLWITYRSNCSILLIPLSVSVCWQNLRITYDNATGIEVVIQSLALTQELRREQQIKLLSLQRRVSQELQRILHIQRTAIPHGDGTLNDHHCIGIHT